jgi:hypothetical protein
MASQGQPFCQETLGLLKSEFVWRGGREAEGAGLLNRCTRKGTVGSNPTLSVLRSPARGLESARQRIIDLETERDEARSQLSEMTKERDGIWMELTGLDLQAPPKDMLSESLRDPEFRKSFLTDLITS